MIAADEWHKYQESYVKYGIDLEPEKSARSVNLSRSP